MVGNVIAYELAYWCGGIECYADYYQLLKNFQIILEDNCLYSWIFSVYFQTTLQPCGEDFIIFLIWYLQNIPIHPELGEKLIIE